MCLCRLAFECGINFYVQAASYHIPDVVTQKQSATRLEQKREFVCSKSDAHRGGTPGCVTLRLPDLSMLANVI